jgi:hypothetical protein
VGDRRRAYRVLLGRLDGKRPLGIPRRRREYNIKIDLQEIGWGGADGIRKRWRALVIAVMNIRVL